MLRILIILLLFPAALKAQSLTGVYRLRYTDSSDHYSPRVIEKRLTLKSDSTYTLEHLLGNPGLSSTLEKGSWHCSSQHLLLDGYETEGDISIKEVRNFRVFDGYVVSDTQLEEKRSARTMWIKQP